MTSLPSRSSSVSCWRHWIRAWGRGELATHDPAAGTSQCLWALAESRVGRTSQPITTVAVTSLVRAWAGPQPDRRRHALGEGVWLVVSHSFLRIREAPLVVHQPIDRGPGYSAVPVGDGRPLREAATSCWARRTRLGDGMRPCATITEPRLVDCPMVQLHERARPGWIT